MVETGLPLEDLGTELAVYPQVLRNVRLERRVPIDEMPGFCAAMSEFEKQLGNRGRIVVRYSGTEPLLRIMAEGDDQKEIDAIVYALAEKAGTELQ